MKFLSIAPRLALEVVREQKDSYTRTFSDEKNLPKMSPASNSNCEKRDAEREKMG
jgi:hypothetical protein